MTIAGYDLTTIADGIRQYLPWAELLAARTKTPVDDALVALLKALLADPAKLAKLAD